MYLKGIFLALCVMLSIQAHAQSEGEAVKTSQIDGAKLSVQLADDQSVTEVTVSSDNLAELRDFDWLELRQLLSDNDPDDVVTLISVFENSAEVAKGDIRVNNFSVQVKGTTADFDKLGKKLNRLLKEMEESMTVE